MTRQLRTTLGVLVLLIVGVAVGVFWYLPPRGTDVFSLGQFVPGSAIYLANRKLIGLHLGAEVLLGGSSLLLAVTFFVLAQARGTRLPFRAVLNALATANLFLGLAFVGQGLTIRWPAYWILGDLKLLAGLFCALGAGMAGLSAPSILKRGSELAELEDLCRGLERANKELADKCSRLRKGRIQEIEQAREISREIKSQTVMIQANASVLAPNSQWSEKQLLAANMVEKSAASLVRNSDILHDLLNAGPFLSEEIKAEPT